jgi:hypothetical protein
MTRSRLRLSLALAAALLAGCSSSGGGGVALAPLTPPPPPTPPGPPPGSISPFPGAADTYFGGRSARFFADADVSIDASRRVTIVGLGNAGFGSNGSEPAHMTVHHNGPDDFDIECCGFGGPRFAPADLVSVPGNGSREWKVPAVNQYADNFELIDGGELPGITYTGCGNTTSFSELGTAQPVALIDFFAVGQGTRQSEMPRSGTAEYSGVADGLWVDGITTRRLWGSKSFVSVDFAAGLVTARLDLVSRGDPFGDYRSAPATALGSFSGSGTITLGPMSSRFEGRFVPAGGYTGSFAGNFFGPRAEEIGLAFQLQGGPGQLISGAAAAAKPGGPM